MNGKDGGWDLSDLEKEIDATVDNLLVEKEDRINPSPPLKAQPQAPPQAQPQAQPQAPPQAQPPPNHPSFSEKTNILDSPTSPTPHTQTSQSFSAKFHEKLEEVEAQLLTLEWDINSKHLNNAITHLQDLRKHSHLGNELEKVVILIQKVLYQLILDESKLTPSALKFLQKSWKAVKGMTDERFSLEIDKETLVRDLIAEFQRLRIGGGVSQEKVKSVEGRETLEERIIRREEGAEASSQQKAQMSLVALDKFMSKLEKLSLVVSEERKKWEGIHQEIINFKAELQTQLRPEQKIQREMHNAELIRQGEYQPSDFEQKSSTQAPSMAASLFVVSGVIFGLSEKQIVRTFPIKKWVSDFFIEKGKVKLKNREVPLFNLCQVFRLQPSQEENPLVILIKGRENRPAAIIIDQLISREEIKYQPIEGRPYIFGQGISKRGKTWILDAEQISP